LGDVMAAATVIRPRSM